jgi:hypothetical protein
MVTVPEGRADAQQRPGLQPRVQGGGGAADACRGEGHALADEFGLSRQALYKWWNHYARGGPEALRPTGRPRKVRAAMSEPTAAKPPGATERIAELERKVGQQVLELDFFKQALRHGTSRRHAGRTASVAPEHLRPHPGADAPALCTRRIAPRLRADRHHHEADSADLLTLSAAAHDHRRTLSTVSLSHFGGCTPVASPSPSFLPRCVDTLTIPLFLVTYNARRASVVNASRRLCKCPSPQRLQRLSTLVTDLRYRGRAHAFKRPLGVARREVGQDRRVEQVEPVPPTTPRAYAEPQTRAEP